MVGLIKIGIAILPCILIASPTQSAEEGQWTQIAAKGIKTPTTFLTYTCHWLLETFPSTKMDPWAFGITDLALILAH